MITLCPHPDRCKGMEAAHADVCAQLAAAQGTVQQQAAQLAQRDAEIARLRVDLAAAKADTQFHLDGFCALAAQKGR